MCSPPWVSASQEIKTNKHIQLRAAQRSHRRRERGHRMEIHGALCPLRICYGVKSNGRVACLFPVDHVDVWNRQQYVQLAAIITGQVPLTALDFVTRSVTLRISSLRSRMSICECARVKNLIHKIDTCKLPLASGFGGLTSRTCPGSAEMVVNRHSARLWP